MNIKNYNLWHKLKTWLHNESERVFFHEREIWFCFLGSNVGFEQDGKGVDFLRPVVIVKKFNNQIFWGIPLTSTLKDSQYYFIIEFDGRKNSAILSQLRLIDAKRLRYKAGVLPEDQFLELTKKLKGLIP
ncbi:MAG: type II toxin-antitoxin system PemK/MazF family toxin [Patescibacteria group bacterium]